MRIPLRCAGVWPFLLVAGALPAHVAPALSQAPERARSLVIVSPPPSSPVAPDAVRGDGFGTNLRGNAGRVGGWSPDGLARRPWHRTGGLESGSRGITYSGPNPWIAAPVTVAWLITLDLAVNDWAQTGWQSDFGDRVSRFGDKLGEGEIMAFVAGGSLFVGAFEGSDGLKRASAVIAGVIAGPINNAAIKWVAGRVRPRDTDNPLDWRPFSGNAAFPSGHVSVPFSIAGALEEATGLEAIAWPFYFAGVLTAYARIYDNAHWFSDVVASAVISSIVSRKATGGVLKAWGLTPGLGKGDDRGASGGTRLRYQRPTGVHASLLAAGTTLGVQLTF